MVKTTGPANFNGLYENSYLRLQMGSNSIQPNLIVILGATATGKTKLAVHVARQLNTEIISADSRQVFRGMNIGTGKDLTEYNEGGEPVPYHLIDILNAGEEYNVHRYQQDFYKAYQDIMSRNKVPILCGGTSLYFNAILKGHAHTPIPEDEMLREYLGPKTKPELVEIFIALPDTPYKKIADTSTIPKMIRAIEICEWEQTHVREENPLAKNLRPVVFGLDMATELKRKRIEERLAHRLANGLVEEVQDLLKKGIPADILLFYGLEYKFVTLHLKGQLTLSEMQTQLTTAIQQFAKRQMTFFRKMEREGLKINWIDATLPVDEQVRVVLESLQSQYINPTIFA